MTTEIWINGPESGVVSLAADPFWVDGEEGLDIGATVWERKEVTSPWTHGSRFVNMVKGMSEGELVVQIIADTGAELNTHLSTLIAAMTQFRYEIHMTIDDGAWAWDCYAADYSVGRVQTAWSNPDKKFIRPRFSFPRHPLPVLGGI